MIRSLIMLLEIEGVSVLRGAGDGEGTEVFSTLTRIGMLSA